MPPQNVLVVDDEPDVRRATVRILEKAHYSVSQASCGEEALAQVRALRPDLVLLDVILPDRLGTDVLKSIRADASLSDMSIVLLSNLRTSGAEQTEGLEAGADGYIARPVANDELLARVRLHLRQLELTRQLRGSQKRYRDLVSQQADAVLVVNSGGAIRFANPAAGSLFGQPVGRLTGTPFGHSLTGHDGRTLEIQRPDSPPTFAEMRVVPTVWDDAPATIVTLRDLTERRRASELVVVHANQLKAAFLKTVELVMNLSELRDPFTVGHERRVGDLAAAIGAALGMDEQRIEGLRIAGQLHDVGKVCVPTEFLAKPAQLSAIEYQMVQRHAEVGYELLKAIESPWPIARIALEHHERLDGSGYPRGLKNGEILLESRILAVADVMEAMTAHRPYRPARSGDAALAEIERGRGLTYDEDVVSACLDLFRDKGYAFPT